MCSPARARASQEIPGFSPTTAVTKFRRSDAGAAEITEAQIRCPAALLLAVDFLFQRVLDADRFGPDPRFGGEPPTLFNIHDFLLDRTRAIRKEWSMQNYVSKERNDALIMEVGAPQQLGGGGPVLSRAVLPGLCCHP